MTFSTFAKQDVQDGIDLLAKADQLAVFVGAGVSAEAGLPRWPELVHQLLLAASAKITYFTSDSEREDWVNRTMLTELPPGAAGIAEILLGRDLAPTLARELYRRPEDGVLAKPSDFVPGPTGHAVAALRRACDNTNRFHHPMKILTTNYDELLEQAFRARKDVSHDEVCSIIWPFDNDELPGTRVKVHHLHGYFKGRSPVGNDLGAEDNNERKELGITLTDSSYHSSRPAVQRRDKEVLEILAKTRCLFLGTSFTDPNIMRYIFTSAEERRLTHRSSDPSLQPHHVAVFSHHSADPPEIRKARQEIAEKRLRDAYTKAVFVEHYADVSQFVFGLRNRIAEDRQYIRHDIRAKRILKPILERVVFPHDRLQFDKAQPALSSRLAEILNGVIAKIDTRAKSALRSEPLALGLWLLDESGKLLTPWVTTDRIHKDPRLLLPVDVAPDSRWLAVRAVCEGKLLRDPKRPSDSRWTYIAGCPLLVDDGGRGRICIGALTISTLTRQTWLLRISSAYQRRLFTVLNNEVSEWLTTASAP